MVLNSIEFKLNDSSICNDQKIVNENHMVGRESINYLEVGQGLINDSIQSNNGQGGDNVLRQENLVLRQEIIKLKKALFMSNQIASQLQTVGNINGNQSIQQIQEKEDKEELFIPLSVAPQPTQSIPKKPDPNQLSCSKKFQNILQYVQDDIIQLHSENKIQQRIDGFEDTLNMLPNMKSPSQQSPMSAKTNQQRLITMNMIDKSIDNLKLREKFINDETSSYQKSPEKPYSYIRKKQYDKENDEDKKRMSCVFEEKCYYEQELQNLKDELEFIKEQEQQIKTQMTVSKESNQVQNQSSLIKKFTPILKTSQKKQKEQLITESKEFTFKDNQINKEKQIQQKKAQHQHSHSSKVETYIQSSNGQQNSQVDQQKQKPTVINKNENIYHTEYQDDNQDIEDSQASIISLNIYKINNQHMRYNSTDNSEKQKQQWVPPSFSQSLAISYLQSPQKKENKERQENEILESKKFDTEALDEIFENQNVMKRFKCLDNYLQDENGLLQNFSNSSMNQYNNETINSFTNHAFQNPPQDQDKIFIDAPSEIQQEQVETEITIINANDQAWAEQFYQRDSKGPYKKTTQFKTIDQTQNLSKQKENPKVHDYAQPDLNKIQNSEDIKVLESTNEYYDSINEYRAFKRKDSNQRSRQSIVEDQNNLQHHQQFKDSQRGNQDFDLIKRSNSFLTITDNSSYNELGKFKFLRKRSGQNRVSLKTFDPERSENPNLITCSFRKSKKYSGIKSKICTGLRASKSLIAFRKDEQNDDNYQLQQTQSHSNNRSSQVSLTRILSKPSQLCKSLNRNPQTQSHVHLIDNSIKSQERNQKVLSRNHYQSCEESNGNTPRFISKQRKQKENKKEFLDAEILYEMQNKSAAKRREEIFRREEEIKKKKLQDKMIKIQELQHQRSQQKKAIQQSRKNSKSPQKSLNKNSATISQQRTPSNDKFLYSSFITHQTSSNLKDNTRLNQQQTSNLRSKETSAHRADNHNISMQNSRRCSNNPANTPLLQTPPCENLGFSRERLTQKSGMTLRSSITLQKQNELRKSIIPGSTSSTANLFKKCTPLQQQQNLNKINQKPRFTTALNNRESFNARNFNIYNSGNTLTQSYQSLNNQSMDASLNYKQVVGNQSVSSNQIQRLTGKDISVVKIKQMSSQTSKQSSIKKNNSRWLEPIEEKIM